MIDQRFNQDSVRLLLAHRVHQNAGVKVATARARDDTAARLHARAAVDRQTRLHRGDADAVARIGNKQALRQRCTEWSPDGFKRKAVESIGLNAFRLQVPRGGQDTNHIGQADMKPGVETGDLGDVGTVRLRQMDERRR